MSIVYIINGRPRVGKDQLTDYMREAYLNLNWHCGFLSSIDPVRDVLNRMGIDTVEKTAADRKLLATVGAAVEEHSQFRTKRCIDYVSQVSSLSSAPAAIFLMVREPEMIDRLRTKLRNLGYIVIRVLVQSSRAEILTNPTDAEADTMPYDYLVVNNGTLTDLRREAVSLVDLVAIRNGQKHAS